uniref:Transcriptional corepressor LEUNIG_HOMOLOG isoform X2 n=1 Tax=Rhizophora mucronata TaxID=61149 RepID=A0A2P2J1B0_RHIMU
MTLLLHAVSSSPNNHIYTHPAFYQLPSCSVPWSQLNKNKSPKNPEDRKKDGREQESLSLNHCHRITTNTKIKTHKSISLIIN